ncbi:MAG: hypothetical protein P4K93_08260 [Terracidiphilus sp.]|nr:hypothetical protein [Terracidiphilus sp.]MDR3798129.1 hypothetical protein [Terracidiphilus sp.]
MKRLALSLFLLFSSIAPAQDKPSAAVKSMSTTAVFAFGGVGFAGVTSQGEKDFRVIYDQPPDAALKSFELVYATGDSEAKSYALVGIHKLDEKRFGELLASLKGSEEKVITMRGCIMEKQSMAEVAKEIQSGQFDYWLSRPR